MSSESQCCVSWNNRVKAEVVVDSKFHCLKGDFIPKEGVPLSSERAGGHFCTWRNFRVAWIISQLTPHCGKIFTVYLSIYLLHRRWLENSISQKQMENHRRTSDFYPTFTIDVWRFVGKDTLDGKWALKQFEQNNANAKCKLTLFPRPSVFQNCNFSRQIIRVLIYWVCGSIFRSRIEKYVKAKSKPGNFCDFYLLKIDSSNLEK